jgi:hypothetical protein
VTRLLASLAVLLCLVPAAHAAGAPAPREIDTRVLLDEDGSLGYGGCTQGQCAPGQGGGALDLLALDAREAAEANGTALIAFRFVVDGAQREAPGRELRLVFTAHGQRHTFTIQEDRKAFTSKDFLRVDGPISLLDGSQAIDAFLQPAALGLAPGDALEQVTVTSLAGGQPGDVMPGTWYDHGVLVPRLPDEAGEAIEITATPAPGKYTLAGPARLLLVDPPAVTESALPYTVRLHLHNPTASLGQDGNATVTLDAPAAFRIDAPSFHLAAGGDANVTLTFPEAPRDLIATIRIVTSLGGYAQATVPLHTPVKASPAPSLALLAILLLVAAGRRAKAPPGRGPALAAVLLLALALSGCASTSRPLGSLAHRGPVVEGWVLDEGLRPVVNATASVAGSTLAARTDGGGHYRLDVPSGIQVTLTVQAAGFAPKSAYVGSGFGERALLNFSLARLPAEKPYLEVADHKGQLTCAVTAVAGQEDPNKPHEHKGVKCADVIPSTVDDSNLWHYTIPAGASGEMLELFWNSTSDLSTSLILKMQVEDTGDIIGFAEGPSPLHVQLSQFRVLQMQEQGHPGLLVTINPGAGTGSHDHGAVGAFVEQPFRVFATAFFNQAVDPNYSVANQ